MRQLKLKFLTPARLKKLDPHAFLDLVETAYGYRPGSLIQRSNARHLAHPRHLAMFLMVDAGLAYSEAGRAIRRHHVTVIHSCRFIERAIATDPEVAGLVAELRAAIAADPDSFKLRPQRLQSVLVPAARKNVKRPAATRLPDVANGFIPGTEELDNLIREGRGDTPRLKVSDLKIARSPLGPALARSPK